MNGNAASYWRYLAPKEENEQRATKKMNNFITSNKSFTVSELTSYLLNHAEGKKGIRKPTSNEISSATKFLVDLNILQVVGDREPHSYASTNLFDPEKTYAAMILEKSKKQKEITSSQSETENLLAGLLDEPEPNELVEPDYSHLDGCVVVRFNDSNGAVMGVYNYGEKQVKPFNGKNQYLNVSGIGTDKEQITINNAESGGLREGKTSIYAPLSKKELNLLLNYVEDHVTVSRNIKFAI
ncbi:MAG: hypothetical protein KAT91_00775 [Candidatus Aenigmarchaeota archaeon]|nr:hypothetical protein [Candidatus Aenigmarchaeota archaeon]